MEKELEDPPILFYKLDMPYGQFSNFYGPHKKKRGCMLVKLCIDGEEWATTEHYYQAMKYKSSDTASIHTIEYMNLIKSSRTPGVATQLARQKLGGRWAWQQALTQTIQKYLDLGVCIRKDWESVKEEVMLKALVAKFGPDNPELMNLLLSTGNRRLVEHTSRDPYWGDGKDGNGQNRLGYLLELVRTMIRTNEPVTNEPVTNEPETNEPVKTKSVTNEPVTNEPVKTKSVKTKSVTNEPVKTKSVTSIQNYFTRLNQSPG